VLRLQSVETNRHCLCIHKEFVLQYLLQYLLQYIVVRVAVHCSTCCNMLQYVAARTLLKSVATYALCLSMQMKYKFQHVESMQCVQV